MTNYKTMIIGKYTFDTNEILNNLNYSAFDDLKFDFIVTPRLQATVLKPNWIQIDLVFNLCATCSNSASLTILTTVTTTTYAIIYDALVANISKLKLTQDQIEAIWLKKNEHFCQEKKWNLEITNREAKLAKQVPSEQALIEKWHLEHLKRLVLCTKLKNQMWISGQNWGDWQKQAWSERFGDDFDFMMANVPPVRFIACFATNVYFSVDNNYHQFDLIDDQNIIKWIRKDLTNYQGLIVMIADWKNHFGQNLEQIDDEQKMLEWLKKWYLSDYFTNNLGRIRAITRAIKNLANGYYQDFTKVQKQINKQFGI